MTDSYQQSSINAGSISALGPTAPTAAVQTADFTAVVPGFYGVDTTGGAVTVNLPTAVGLAGQILRIQDWGGDAAANNITIDAAGAETINGVATEVIGANFATRTIISDGSQWIIVK